MQPKQKKEADNKTTEEGEENVPEKDRLFNIHIHRLGYSDTFECDRCPLKGDIHYMKQHACSKVWRFLCDSQNHAYHPYIISIYWQYRVYSWGTFKGLPTGYRLTVGRYWRLFSHSIGKWITTIINKILHNLSIEFKKDRQNCQTVNKYLIRETKWTQN